MWILCKLAYQLSTYHILQEFCWAYWDSRMLVRFLGDGLGSTLFDNYSQCVVFVKMHSVDLSRLSTNFFLLKFGQSTLCVANSLMLVHVGSYLSGVSLLHNLIFLLKVGWSMLCIPSSLMIAKGASYAQGRPISSKFYSIEILARKGFIFQGFIEWS